MNTLQSWVFGWSPEAKIALWLILKITVALLGAWLLHASLGGVNPRWRRLAWRATAVGFALIVFWIALPPLIAWRVLPPPPAADAAAPIDQLISADENSPADPSSASGAVTFGAAAGSTATIVPDEDAPKITIYPPIPAGQPYVPEDVVFAPLPPLVPPVLASTAPEIAPAKNLPAPQIAQVAQPAGPPFWPALWRGFWAVVTSWQFWVGVWCVGALAHSAYTVLGMWRLRMIHRQAVAAPAWVVDRTRVLSEQLGCPCTPGLVATDEIGSPCIMGVWRPVILMPLAQCDPKFAHELPAILIHELAHLRGRDVPWQLIVHTMSVALWFHPLAWRIRVAHAAACDSVCDSVAAHHMGDANLYGRILARLTIRIMKLRAVSGMAMAQGSNVRRRIEDIERRIFPASLARGPAWCAVMMIVSLSVLIGGLTLARAQSDPPLDLLANAGQEEASHSEAATLLAAGQTSEASVVNVAPSGVATPQVDSSTEETPGMDLTVLDEDGQPVSDAKLRCFGRVVNEPNIDQTLRTDAGGHAHLKLKPGATIINVWMTCDHAGLVPVHHCWQSDQQRIELPASLTLRLKRGVPVSGVVEDEQGRPIANADVTVFMPITWPRLANYIFDAARLNTDAEGRWTWDGAPADLTDVNVTVAHPKYLRGRGCYTDRKNRAVLNAGLTVGGHVLDGDGQPVAGAKVRLGFDCFGSSEPQATTDDNGRFALLNCKPGKSLVTVQADQFSPQFKDVVVGEENADLDFQLDPGHTVRVRVVDSAGRPIRGACFCADTWRGFRTLELRIETNDEGRAEWTSAPNDGVLCDLFRAGFMSVRRTPVQAGQDETVITLPDELIIRGRVTDTAGRAIPNFAVRLGMIFENAAQTYWSNDEPTPFEQGLYRIKFDEPMQGRVLQFVAPGYVPAQSRVFQSSEGKQSFDIQLERGDGPSGVVLLPDGLPAVGADVGLATANSRANLAGGHFHRGNRGAEVVKTDERGAFTLSPRATDEPFTLVVVHDGGFAAVASSEFAGSSEIRLQPWGRIEGRAMRGDQPDAKRQITFWPKREAGNDVFFNCNYAVETDSDGRFVLDRVVPGPGNVARIVVTRFINSWQNAPGWQTPVEVPAGGTAPVTIGGTGRRVRGKVVLDRQPDVATDWVTNEPATLGLGESNPADRLWFRCAANIDREGAFEIPDVPAGRYKLTVPINATPKGNGCGAGTVIGRAALDVVVPSLDDRHGDEPLELGTITAALFETLDPGEAAPDFALPDFDGETVRLSDYRGRLVLVNFWASWSQPCRIEMPHLTAIHKRFAADPRFAMLGLACNRQVDVARQYLEKQPLPWPQLHAGEGAGNLGATAKQYGVNELPDVFLIGPDGRILAKNPKPAELEAAITATLADETAFATTAAVAP